MSPTYYLTLVKSQLDPSKEVITCATPLKSEAEEVATYNEPGEARVVTLAELNAEVGSATADKMVLDYAIPQDVPRA